MKVTRMPSAPFLPMSREEMEGFGWDVCDVVLVTGDAYVDHPSFGAAIVGRLIESLGYRVGIVAQPDWTSAAAFAALGRPRLFFGVTAGNMDSMVNRYTSERRLRHDDAYTPDGAGGKRPDRAVVVYAQRCREAFRDVPVVIGGIEASLRRIAHYDYWSDKVRRSVLMDAKADILVYGNAERAIAEIARRAAAGEAIRSLSGIRGTATVRGAVPDDWAVLDMASPEAVGGSTGERPTVVRLPSYEAVRDDPILEAQAVRVLHQESNPLNGRPLVQRHGDKEVWLEPPALPLETAELDALYELPYARSPHPAYGKARIPAWEMIRFSVAIMRGCFGGCTFCSITAHEGRIVQSRSEASVLREIEAIRDRTPGFTGTISDLGGPTANMYRLGCKSARALSVCRRPSCVFPEICKNLGTDHGPLVHLYRKARTLMGVKRVFVASGVRYDLAVLSPDYVRELAEHHVGGYLKVAPEHTEPGPLGLMMKPGIEAFETFRDQFDRFSKAAGKRQYLIPYFIAAHPGTTDKDMLRLALWLKRHGFKPDQVQAFLPSPMSLATAMWRSGRNPLRPLGRGGEEVFVPKGEKRRRLHKAFLRWHDPENAEILREALVALGRRDLIGAGPQCLVPEGRGKRPGKPVRC